MTRTLPLRLLALAFLAGAALWLPGCDNPACVFGGDCFGNSSTGALGAAPASVPANGEWLTPAAPEVDRVLPTGSATIDSRSPLVVVFTESMSSSGMATLFALQNSSGLVVATLTALVGDGRVLVLLPAGELTADETFTLRYNPNAHVQDRNGQALAIPTDTQLATFTVSANNAATPKLVMSWPADNATFQGEKGEIVAVFDRPLDEDTLDSDSFHVQVNGADLVPPVDPQILALGGGLTHDARVVRWRDTDSAGLPLPLGLDALVALELSPAGHALLDGDGTAVPHAIIDYHTAPFGPPLGAAIVSVPSDAIGIDAISGPENLAIQVQLEGAQSGDHLGFYWIGTEPDVVQDPILICLARDVALVEPFTDFTLTAQELDLRASNSPLKARFADGSLHLALELRRGSNHSPITLLDVDPAQAGEQAPVLDTLRPTLLGLGATGTTTTSFSSDLRDLAVVGRASELLRAATVSCSLGDNTGGSATPPTVAGSSPDGLFVCRPVALGLLDPTLQPLAFELTIYDRALNSAGPLPSTFRQLGGVGPGNTSFTEIAVRVFDATTRAPLAGAAVYTHERDPSGVLPITDTLTAADGTALIAASTLGAQSTILTVSLAGYELFSFDGVTSGRVDVPLAPLVQVDGTIEGTVSSSAPLIALYTGLVSDSRLDHPGSLFAPVDVCAFDPTLQSFSCPYDPYPILPRRIGAESAFAVLVPPSVLLYTPAAFLKAATFDLPLAPAAPGAALTNDLVHSHLLDGAGVDPEEAAIDAPAQLLATTFYPSLAGPPVVDLEATSPGMPGTVVVGVGAPFGEGLPPGTFAVRAAYPGVVDGIQDDTDDALGTLVTQGTLDPDLRLRMQVADVDGNIGGVRPRLSSNPVAADLPAPPALGGVPIALDPFGAALDLRFTDVLPDAAAQPGLYRVVLTATGGGRWVIWTTDPPDSNGPEVQVHLPFLGPGPDFPLAAGDLGCRISLFAWPALDQASYLWSDVEREFDLFSHSKLLTVTPP
jgi:Bacterial Ig-like domain